MGGKRAAGGPVRAASHPAMWLRGVAAGSLLVVAACSGGSDAGDSASDGSVLTDSPSVSTNSSSTTVTPETTAAPGPDVPGDAPLIVNTGDDFEAMYRSFNEFINWLAMNPNPELVDLVYSPRGPAYEPQIESNRVNQDVGLRAGGRWQNIEAIEQRGLREGPGGSPFYDMIVTLSLPPGQVLDASGGVYSEREPVTVRLLVTLLEDDGRWRIGDSVELL